MVENNNETRLDWFCYLFGITSGCLLGFLSITLIDRLIDEVESRSQLEDNIDAIDECLTDIKKLLKYDI